MKNMILTAVIIITALVTLSSLTYKDAEKRGSHYTHIYFSIPIKPKMTVIVKEKKVYTYLKKGFQVQNVWYDHFINTNMFVLVKY